MGIRVSEPTVQRILADHGFGPSPRRGRLAAPLRAAVKDAIWAIDYFAVRTARGSWMQVLLVIDVYSRELLDLRAHDGWDVDAAWTTRAFNEILVRTGRKPAIVVCDHGTTFMGHFERGLRVLGIERLRTPVGMPNMNGFAESAIRGVRWELLRHVRFSRVEHLQFLLDEFRRYRNDDRAHQGIDGRTPTERASATPEAKIIDLATVRAAKLERREYAYGLLHGYSLVTACGASTSPQYDQSVPSRPASPVSPRVARVQRRAS